ncbi:MAG TPA: hypothetical protein DDZ88_13355 [Verrucomicrobiales bacterium]|nr:hypothetical protein [Verrucomicrobiales bacterium]
MLRNMIPATIVQGHRVASGLNGNPRFPGGTLRMQLPFFRDLGLDLSRYHLGTLNVSIAPLSYRVVQPKWTFQNVKWHPAEPAEDFSFFDVVVHREGAKPASGLIYFPHPDTKPEHFQSPDVLELLLPWTEGLGYNANIRLDVPAEQMAFTPTPPHGGA